MSSYSTHLFIPLSPLNLTNIDCLPSSFSTVTNPTYQFPNKLFSGAWLFGAKDKRFNFDFGLKCCAISKSQTKDVFQNGVPVIKLPTIVEDDTEKEATKVSTTNEIKERVESIKSKLVSLDDGEISISAYDTAWVALVGDINGNGKPQFPSSLVWICNNQLPDGSWGDSEIYSAHDRLINTLACVIALKSWNLNPEKCNKGMKFFKENLSKLENENAVHMPIGFEIAFPSLLEIARKLNLQVPEDSPVLKEIYAGRDIKLTRIPKELMHKVPTTLLHSLEGMEGLEWEKLLKLQSQDGSFLFSPSSTAFALIQTKDENCLKYLCNAVNKFNGGVPNVYPVDLFEHIWIPDRLQRLGISRFFESEIKECLSYVYRYWNEKGICWARNSDVHDIDDTAMGFRQLRLHGYKVSPDAFQQFKTGEEFVCFAGQATPAVTGMFNLYRASQALFPGETILEEAMEFSYKFLREKQASNELLDKWIITKDLPGEVDYALGVPWYASLPRVETRFYIEQYGGQNDVWIGKTLYRMPYVNNNEYLELAKLDYNNCQALHLMEWEDMQKWYAENKLKEHGLSKRSLLLAYFLAASSIFEPEKANERLTWAKTSSLIETIASYFGDYEHRTSFVREFRNTTSLQNYVNLSRKSKVMNRGCGLVETLVGTFNQLSIDSLVTYGCDISLHLYQAWEKWLVNWQEEGDRHKQEAELLVKTINLCASRTLLKEQELFFDGQYDRLFDLTNTLCSGLRHYQNQKHKEHNGINSISRSKERNSTNPEIELKMQELVQIVLQNSLEDGLDSKIKQTFLTVVKTFYYAAYCDPGTINGHIDRVLFDRLMN